MTRTRSLQSLWLIACLMVMAFWMPMPFAYAQTVVLDDTFTRANTVVGSGANSVGSGSIGAGTGYTDNVGNIYNISSNTLAFASNVAASSDLLCTSVAGQSSQKAALFFHYTTASTATFKAMLRYIDTNNYYAAEVITAAGVGHVSLIKKVAGTVTVISPGGGVGINSTTLYSVTLTVDPTQTPAAIALWRNETSNSVIDSKDNTFSAGIDAGLTAAGNPALGVDIASASGVMNEFKVTNLGTPSMTVSPTTLTAGTSGQVVTFAGTNSHWVPGTTTFSGTSTGTGFSVTSSSSTSATAGTATITTGTTGTATMTNSLDAGTATITISATAPTLVVTAPTPVSSASSITITPSVSGGVQPYAYAWYRSATSGFTPGVGNQLAAITTTLPDVPPDRLVYFYRLIVTDMTPTTPQVVTSSQLAGALYQPAISIGFMGDSITHGYPGGAAQSPTGTMPAYLQTYLGPRTITLNNQGVSGTTANDWQPGGGNYTTAIASFVNSTTTPWVMIMLGTNDASTTYNVSAATYKTRMLAIVSALVTAGYKVILNAPPYWQPGVYSAAWTASALDVAGTQYPVKLDEIVTQYASSNPNTVFAGDRSAFAYFATHQTEIADGLHPNATGYADLGWLWTRAFLNAAYPAATSGGSASRGIHAGGKL